MKVLYYITQLPSDTKNAHINIYKDYQNRNIKLETIFIEIFGFQNIWLVYGNCFRNTTAWLSIQSNL